jgi:hypothetical protein
MRLLMTAIVYGSASLWEGLAILRKIASKMSPAMSLLTSELGIDKLYKLI